MKTNKRMINLAACCLGIITFVACGPNVSLKDLSVTGADGTVYNSYQTACSKGDFDAARDYVGKMKEKFIVVKADGDYNEKKAFEEAIQEAENYVENEEIQFLASLNEEQANNRIILILNQRSIVGLEAAENACLGKKVMKRDLDEELESYSNDSPEEIKNFKRYIAWCGNHNSRCNTILSIAIACGNKNLAEKIIYIFRPDPELLLRNEYIDNGGWTYYDVYAHYANTSKEAAQKKYDEAEKSGAFN